MILSREALIEQAIEGLNALMSYRRRAMCEQPLLRHVSMPQFYVLMTLQERGPMTVSELAGLLNVSPPSASALLDRIEEHGLIERVRDIDDRRVVRVHLLPEGRKMVEELSGMKREHLVGLFDSMSDEDLEHVIHGAAAIERALRGATGGCKD